MLKVTPLPKTSVSVAFRVHAAQWVTTSGHGGEEGESGADVLEVEKMLGPEYLLINMVYSFTEDACICLVCKFLANNTKTAWEYSLPRKYSYIQIVYPHAKNIFYVPAGEKPRFSITPATTKHP